MASLARSRRAAAACLLLALGAAAAAQDWRAAAGEVERGLTALHHFEYEQANEAFRRAQAQDLDRRFVLAYWGEAMTYFQTLWRKEDVAAGRQALARLAPTPAARAAKAVTPKERDLLSAAEVLFGAGDASVRHARYADAMLQLADRYPDDPDIVSLAALAVIGTASRGLVGFGDAHDDRLAGSDVQQRAAALLTRVLSSHPKHPGALHYLLHTYDDPQHAAQALEAAKTYASVANGASHALHMPAHIFLQLGLWHDASASDRAAYDASRDWVQRKNLPLALRNYHALSWLQYELLQLGRYADARRTIDEIEPVVRASGAAPSGDHGRAHQPLLSDLSSMRARYAIETRRWESMATETSFGNVNDLFAIGMSAARTGRVAAARTVQQTLEARATSAQEGDLRPAIAIMEREMAALIVQADGRMDLAIGIATEAAHAELGLPAPFGPPAPIKPAPELLGELLVDAGRAREAIPQFESVLRLHANRSLSVLGLARAAAAAGETAIARERYQQLLASFDRADADLPDAAEARAFLASGAPSEPRQPAAPSRQPTLSIVVAIAIAGLVGMLLVAIRATRRRSVERGATRRPRH